MHTPQVSRRSLLVATGGLAAIGAGRRVLAAEAPALPTAPVTLNVVDVGGALQLVQSALEEYRRAHPKLVDRITYTQAPAPELPGKLRAQQDAGRVDIDLVLTGMDALSAGIEQKLWLPVVTDHAASLPKLDDIYQKAVLPMQALAMGQAVCVVFCPAGPLLEYMPDKVPTPPTTTDELLAWTRAHPKRFFYARPANSGPGRAWLMGLPYLLGDSNPKDPKNGWDKTWSYLAELGKNIEYYPTGTTVTMKELGEGSRDMIVTMTGWDINPRALGVVPKEAMVGTLKGFHFVNDAQFMAVPKGVSAPHLAVLLDLMSYMLTPKAQAMTYDKGYFYPGPAVKNVTLAMAPQASQEIIKEYGRPFYDKLIAETPNEVPLDAPQLVYAFKRWDEQIGSKVGQ